ncbi:hypothetical protein O181_022789 [Austropuccinia psidii MF-1]|uniref:Uncharacterized protein n=1 Tax=Austropuccinia psidii MF-1 TaxID=1389203 RepID=A0A9Q3CDA3_9BASI|nr:hypothetical protein [Austropuccinia psidii MF-1]
MTVQNSPPAKNTRYQRNQAVLTPTERAPPDRTLSVHQVNENLDRGPPTEGAETSTRGGPRRRLGEAEYEEGEESVKEEESEEGEVKASLGGAPEDSETPSLALSNQRLVSQDDGENDSIHGIAHSSSFPQG